MRLPQKLQRRTTTRFTALVAKFTQLTSAPYAPKWSLVQPNHKVRLTIMFVHLKTLASDVVGLAGMVTKPSVLLSTASARNAAKLVISHAFANPPRKNLPAISSATVKVSTVKNWAFDLQFILPSGRVCSIPTKGWILGLMSPS